jgi:hypothetical protein
LIAEEVAAMYPELVTPAAAGEVQAVRYQELHAARTQNDGDGETSARPAAKFTRRFGSTADRANTSHGPSWHRRAQEGKPDLHPRIRTEVERFDAVLGTQPALDPD